MISDEMISDHTNVHTNGKEELDNQEEDRGIMIK